LIRDEWLQELADIACCRGIRRVIVGGEDSHRHGTPSVHDEIFRGESTVSVEADVQARVAELAERRDSRRLVHNPLPQGLVAGQACLQVGRRRAAGVEVRQVHVQAVAGGQQAAGVGLGDQKAEQLNGHVGGQDGDVGAVGHGRVRPVGEVLGGDGDGRQAARDGAVRGPDGPGAGVRERAEIVALVGAGDQEIRLGAVPDLCDDIVERKIGGGRRSAIIVPYAAVVGICAPLFQSFRNLPEF
jgi:hypothetical protein